LSIFLRTDVIFCTKNKLDILRKVQFLIRRRPVRSFSPGAVATIAVYKSEPMLILSVTHAVTPRL